ncbi:YbdD/YjiX family protein [Novosphingobium sp. BW1]|uniref:CstA-like transporter-associated (seleno)protein n=1 Tax=Novosphingobium sp. BW1 TaxID=2592621 RepID=UPI0011DEA4F0|nr:YbdD/YjiX family protein [Novosphingobium sp. BW1]TYC90456.1 YbdD/YjiX family protein [Novosphingobium sp. BW1]
MKILRDTLRLMVGQPPYEVYLAHMARRHPDVAPMSRVEFFRNREAARFGGAGGGKCC